MMTGNTLQLQDFHMKIEIIKENFFVLSKIYLKQSFHAQFVLQKYDFHYQWYCWATTWSNIMFCESQVCVPTIWSTLIKWLSFGTFKKIALGFSQAPILKYSVFWSGNAPKILKKTKKKSIFWQRIKIFKIFLMITIDYCLN